MRRSAMKLPLAGEASRREPRDLRTAIAPKHLRANWTPTIRQALLLALPLAIAAMLGWQLLDADFVMLRERANAQAEAEAGGLGAAASQAVAALANKAFADMALAKADLVDPTVRPRQMSYDYNIGLMVLLRRDGRRLFPPQDDGLALPKTWEYWLRPLEAAADLQPDGDRIFGWYPAAAVDAYFECRRQGSGAQREESCIALTSDFVLPAVFAALEKAARPDWSFLLRDPLDRLIWSHGLLGRYGAPAKSFYAVALTGAMRGWRIDAAGATAPQSSILARLALATPLALVWLLLVWQGRREQQLRLAESAARGALAARLSHDLRTPLANLKLYAELIARKIDGARTEPRLQHDLAHYCKVLTQEVDRLEILAGETIALGAQIAAPGPHLNVAAPAQLASGILDRYRALMAASGCSCELDCPASEPLRFDLVAFERILVNLLDNARKYAPGRICVKVELIDRLLTISVRDFGAKSDPQIAVASYGLGLGIVRELTLKNGGAFSLSAAHPGFLARATLLAEPVEHSA